MLPLVVSGFAIFHYFSLIVQIIVEFFYGCATIINIKYMLHQKYWGAVYGILFVHFYTNLSSHRAWGILFIVTHKN